jgi:1-acyl-sn-glycerol-3-phosphate acyltransferase
MSAPGSQEVPNVDRTADQEPAAQVIRVIRDLAVELHPHLKHTLSVELDSDLDRDLGLDSLGRVELVQRLDKAFNLRLPGRLIGEAETPRDLVNAVLRFAPDAGVTRELATAKPLLLPVAPAPKQAATLLEAFDYHVRTHSHRPHLLLSQDGETEERISYADLDRSARAVARGLLERGLATGDRIAIMLPTEAAFFQAFLGVLMAGGIPVPIYPPFRQSQVEDHLRRQAGILRNAEASMLITGAEIRPLAGLLKGLTDSLERIETVANLTVPNATVEPRPAGRESLALIQYTSGSTGDPKGVMLSHANLLANIRSMAEALEASSADIFVSWLPLYHDMGLIGAWLGCLYFGVPTVIMPPLAFLTEPARWLWAIHRHRATLSAGPNFAFELCVKNVREKDLAGLDLSSLRMLCNGAEPVSPSTIARFTEKFRPHGFKATAMAPVYGLAENAVGLAFPPLGRVPIVDRVDREALSRDGVARPAQPNGRAIAEFVACGHPLPGHEVRIVDPTGRELPERHEGRLQFKGPSATRGYFRNEEKTRGLFDGEWLESGDRAYIANGDIFITGRIKDIIIRGGRNIYPHELEEAIGAVEGVRKGCVAAFPSRDEHSQTERLVVMAETRVTEPEARATLSRKVGETAIQLLGLPPDDIVLVPPHTVPKTSSGKIRRSAARTLYEGGDLGARQRPLWLQLSALALSGAGRRLRRGKRVVLDACYAAYWWCAVALFLVATWPLVALLPRRSWRHAVVHYGARGFLRATGLGPVVEVEDPVPRSHVLLVANHASYLDGVVLSAAVPGELTFVAKSEFKRQFFAGTLLERLGALFTRRVDPRGGVADTEAQIRAAKAGERIVSFPEGTLTRMPGLLPFHLGAFVVATEAQIPVLPVTISGTRSALRGGQWWPRRSTLRVHIGKPLVASGLGLEAAARLRDAARAAILAKCGEPDLAREHVVIPSAGNT